MTRHAIVFAEADQAAPVVAGVSVLERLLRGLVRSGVSKVLILGSEPEVLEATLARSDRARSGLAIQFRSRAAGPPRLEELRDAWPRGESHALVFPGLGLFDLRTIKTLVRSGRSLSLVDSAAPPGHATGRPPGPLGPLLLDRPFVEGAEGELAGAVLAAVERGAIAAADVAAIPSYIPSMRRELRPWWLPPPLDELARRRAEDLIIGAAQKQALDFPAYVHAPVENALVRVLCTTSLTPNQASLVGNVVAYVATALFAAGWLGWGIALAMIVGVLDGVDGKLARVKVETSDAGKLEHWFDGLFEVSWAVAIAFFLAGSGTQPDAWWLLLLLLGAEAVDGAAKGAIILGYGRQIDDVAAFDRLVRLFGGRRNVYVWILAAGIALGQAGPAFALVAWWEAVTAVIHVLRAAWLLALRRRRLAP